MFDISDLKRLLYGLLTLCFSFKILSSLLARREQRGWAASSIVSGQRSLKWAPWRSPSWTGTRSKQRRGSLKSWPFTTEAKKGESTTVIKTSGSQLNHKLLACITHIRMTWHGSSKPALPDVFTFHSDTYCFFLEYVRSQSCKAVPDYHRLNQKNGSCSEIRSDFISLSVYWRTYWCLFSSPWTSPWPKNLTLCLFWPASGAQALVA